MRVKRHAQEHNTVTRPGLEPGPFDPESSAVTIGPPHLPQNDNYIPFLYFSLEQLLKAGGTPEACFSTAKLGLMRISRLRFK